MPRVGAGALFLVGRWLLDDFGQLRGFVAGTGDFLSAGKAVIVGVRSAGVGPFFLPGVVYVRLVIGA